MEPGELAMMLLVCSVCSIFTAMGIAHRVLWELEGLQPDSDWWMTIAYSLGATLILALMMLPAGASTAIWLIKAYTISTAIITPPTILIALVLNKI